MNNTAIIIPTRLAAKRFPNKPLAKINNIPMIVHVMNKAKESKVGEVFVATPDKEISEVVKKFGGQTIMTKNIHTTGSDRVYEAYVKKLKNNSDIDLIINLQGDMPNIRADSILKLEKFMKNEECEIGTLASTIKNEHEASDKNIVKVEVNDTLKSNNFLNVKDFFRSKKNFDIKRTYHHIGIYAFTNEALTKYVKLPKTKLEIERNLEQMRALENNMLLKVGFCDSTPLSVDTEEDFKKITEEMI